MPEIHVGIVSTGGLGDAPDLEVLNEAKMRIQQAVPLIQGGCRVLLDPSGSHVNVQVATVHWRTMNRGCPS